mmetsp:Transcript_30836/g.68312  ORF Transcript_30836/g.68312 Transcript_30836/m.68312 type:complete len:834 (+) Transcript_30836:1396-3897(+)
MGASLSCSDPADDVILLHSTSSLHQPPLPPQPQPAKTADGGDHLGGCQYDLRYRHHNPYDRPAGASTGTAAATSAAPGGRNLGTCAACPSRTSSVPTSVGGARGAPQSSSPDVYDNEYLHRTKQKKKKSLIGKLLPGRTGGSRQKRRGLNNIHKRKKNSMPLSGECRHDGSSSYQYPSSHDHQYAEPRRKHPIFPHRKASSRRGGSSNSRYERYSGQDGRGREEGCSHNLDSSLMGGLMTPGGGGVRNFLLMTGERDVAAASASPTAASAVAQSSGRNGSLRGGSRREEDDVGRRVVGDGGAKAVAEAATTSMTTMTKLFYRDPCDLEGYGFDVTDEATVAGRQIYAARVAIPVNRDEGGDDGNDDDGGNDGDDEQRVGVEASPPSAVEDDGSTPPRPTEARTVVRKKGGNSSTAGSGALYHPHPAEITDDGSSCLLLPPLPADEVNSTVVSTKKRGRSWSFPTKRSKKGDGDGRAVHAHNDDGRRRNHGGSTSCSCLYDYEIGSYYRNTSCPQHGDASSSSSSRDHCLNSTTSSHGQPLYRYRREDVPPYPRGCASFLFSREAVRNNTAPAVTDVACVDEENRIYVADIGLTLRDCRCIINVTERCSRGTYSAYTYAKQTLGCREHDDVAAVCVGPVMTAAATIMDKLEATITDTKYEGKDDADTNVFGNDVTNGDEGSDNDNDVVAEQPMQERRPDSKPTALGRRKRDLVLDDREPHLVKYDVSKKERQKLDMHTDKSEWTFLISLSEGCGADFKGGGTYFECIDSTVHLSRGQALIFPGKLRHRGQKITSGHRFLLVGFLVDKNEEMKKAASKKAATSAPAQVRGAPVPN